jgi:hypothetical protein
MSYHVAPEPAGLGFSLRPPAWLRSAVGSGIKALTGKVAVSVPTPVGPVELSAKEIAEAVKKAKFSVTVGTKPPSMAEQVAERVPGGFGTLGLLGGAAIAGLLFMALSRRRGRA